MKNLWRTLNLGNVCDFEGGSQPPKSEFIYDEKPGYLRFLQIRDFGSDKNITYIRFSKKNRLCAESDILIGRYGASVGKILTNRAGAYNVALMKTIPNPEFLERSWFYHYLVSDEFQLPLLKVADRSAQAGFSKEDIYNFAVPIPPLSEQQRIVTILDEAFAGIATAKASAEKNLRNARALFESYLQSVFTNGGKDWTESTLGKFVCFENGDRGKNYPNRHEYIESGIPWINTGHIQPNGRLSESDMNFISREKYISLRSGKIQPGDLVYCLRGATLGKTAFVDPFAIGAIASSLVIIRPGASISRHFLYYFLISPVGQERIKLYGNGAAQPNLGAKSVAKFKILLPSFSEQTVIAKKILNLSEHAQRLESLYQRKLAALDELKKSLLHEAFSGRL